jgi:hypothetical protein
MSYKASVIGGKKLRAVAKALRDAGDKGMARNLQKRIKDAGKPALTKLQDSARAIKVTGYKTPARRKYVAASKPKDLRNRIAAATSIEFTATARGAKVRFQTSSAKLGKEGVLPRYFDLGTKFRHPIQGHRSRWADETGEPWFFEPIKESLKDYRTVIDEALDDTASQIEASI